MAPFASSAADDGTDLCGSVEGEAPRVEHDGTVLCFIAEYILPCHTSEDILRKPPGPESSLSKMVVSPLQQAIASLTVELQGALGATMDESITPFAASCQSAWLSAPGMRLAGGTDEILHNIVAERVLGLPGEIRADKGVAFQDIPTGSR